MHHLFRINNTRPKQSMPADKTKRLLTLGAIIFSVLLFNTAPLHAVDSANASDQTSGHDWPQGFGPTSTGISNEKMPNLANMTEAWRQQIGLGYAGIATANGRVYTMGHDGKENETLFCFSMVDGKEMWKQSYPGKLIASMHTGGPNATPLITATHIFTVSKDGQVHCRLLTDGSLVWQASLPQILEVEIPNWGFGCSPQIINNQLILSIGKTVALNPTDGKTIWVSDTKGKASYATPQAFTINDQHYLAIMTAEGAGVLSLADGKTLATFPMKAKYNMIAASPIIFPDSAGEFFVSTSSIAARLRFDGTTLKPVWTTTAMLNKMSTSLLINDHLYGVHGGQGSRLTQLVCIAAKTGAATWIKDGTGHGNITASKDALCFLSDDGELLTFAADPQKFTETGRRNVLEKTCWTAPTLSHGRIFVRNDQGTLVCLVPK